MGIACTNLLPNALKNAAPVPGQIIVDKSPPLNNGFSGLLTRDGSTPAFSYWIILTHLTI
jgi:hypothetical protein